MFTPMLVQYLVGLCCMRRDPEAVEVMIGDMVMDAAAEEERDVDITVTLAEPDGSVRAFKAYEVKRESKPLNVAKVEQLCAKLLDMPAVTHRAIVSASGFSESAIQKATRRGVELYALNPWNQPLANQFPEWSQPNAPSEVFHFGKTLLVWLPERQFYIIASGGPSSFNWTGEDLVFSEDGKPHAKFACLGDYLDALMFRSTNILIRLETAAWKSFPRRRLLHEDFSPDGPVWPHTHTLDATSDRVFLKPHGRAAVIDSVTISGELQWQSKSLPAAYYVLERVPDGEVLMGAAIGGTVDDEELIAFIIPPNAATAGVHSIKLAEKHRNAIRRLKLELPSAPLAKEP